MYNRYIPKADGSFQRNWMPDPPSEPPPPCPPAKSQNANTRDTIPISRRPQPAPPGPAPSIGAFFKQLIPKDFCTEDLLIVLLLLLMSGDSKEDQNFALLTLALYLFL